MLKHVKKYLIFYLRKNYGHKREHQKKPSTSSKDKKENGKATTTATPADQIIKTENHSENHIA